MASLDSQKVNREQEMQINFDEITCNYRNYDKQVGIYEVSALGSLCL